MVIGTEMRRIARVKVFVSFVGVAGEAAFPMACSNSSADSASMDCRLDSCLRAALLVVCCAADADADADAFLRWPLPSPPSLLLLLTFALLPLLSSSSRTCKPTNDESCCSSMLGLLDRNVCSCRGVLSADKLCEVLGWCECKVTPLKA